MDDKTVSLLARHRQPSISDELLFLLTNRIPRHLLSSIFAWFSRIELPWVARPSLALWRRFSRLDLSDASSSRFRSVHDCFTRQLRPGARSIAADPDVLVSPCDAIVSSTGVVSHGQAVQCKGMTYRLADLLGSANLAARHEGGAFVGMRLTSGMYHHFHSADDCAIDHIAYISGDKWNVNPISVRRIERLYCRNERLVMSGLIGESEQRLTIVAVAAVLVASMRLAIADVSSGHVRSGARLVDYRGRVRRGERLGWFEHGSTIVLLTPPGYVLSSELTVGSYVRVGQVLLIKRNASGSGPQ